MKKILKIFLLLASMGLLLAGCSASASERVDLNVNQEIYQLKDTFKYSLTTQSKDLYAFGSDFIIEKEVDGEWQTYNDKIPSTMEMNYITNGQDYEFNRELLVKDFIEEAGHYRLVKTVRNDTKDENIELNVEFDVK